MAFHQSLICSQYRSQYDAAQWERINPLKNNDNIPSVPTVPTVPSRNRKCIGNRNFSGVHGGADDACFCVFQKFLRSTRNRRNGGQKHSETPCWIRVPTVPSTAFLVVGTGDLQEAVPVPARTRTRTHAREGCQS